MAVLNSISWDEAAYSRTSEEAWAAFIKSRFAALATPKLTVGPSVQSRMIEQELRMLKKYLSVAFRCRNAVSGAAALPAEVLSTIFTLAQDGGWQPRHIVENGTSRFDLGWINVSHVCSMWRQTALRTPALWPKISCPHLPSRMLPEVIRRARDLPLELYVDTTAFKQGNFPVERWLCEPIVKRCKSVFVTSRDIDETSRVIHCLPPAEYSLKELAVDLDITDCGGDWCLFEPEVNMAVAGYFPALDRLSLRGCFPCWGMLMALPDNLTRLSLAIDGVDGSTDPRYRPDARRFRDALVALPHLQHLILENFFPEPLYTATANMVPLPGGPFTITQLRSLTVICNCSWTYEQHYGYFWRNFRVPRTAIVQVDLSLGRAKFKGDYLAPITFMGADAELPLEMTLSKHTVSVRYSEIEGDYWTGRSNPDPFYSPTTDQYWDVDTLRGSRHIHDADTYVVNFANQLPLPSLRAIFLPADVLPWYHDPDDWISSFSTAQDVRRLSFTYPTSYELLVALARTAQRAHDAPSLALFPRLDTLIFHGDATLHGSKDDQIIPESLDVALFDVLSTRARCDAPIKRIFVSKQLASWEVWEHIDHAAIAVAFF
ncbi:unnamed protein product [Peniophora sp. CBMAI 1063]|nr:unnamed protein product [Peniophora sp. CBMAI 1063]